MAPKTRKDSRRRKQKDASVKNTKNRRKNDSKLVVSLWRRKLQQQLQADGDIAPDADSKTPCSSRERKDDGDLAAKIRDSFLCLSDPSRFAERIKQKFYVLSSRSMNRSHLEGEERPARLTPRSSSSKKKNKKVRHVKTSMQWLVSRQQMEKECKLRMLREENPKMDFLVLQNILAGCRWEMNQARQMIASRLNCGLCIQRSVSPEPVTRRRRKRSNPVKVPAANQNVGDETVDNSQGSQPEIKPEELKLQLQRALQSSSKNDEDSDCEILEVLDPDSEQTRIESDNRSCEDVPSGSSLRQHLQ